MGLGKSLALCAVGLLLLTGRPAYAADRQAKGEATDKAGAENAVGKSAAKPSASASQPDWAMNATIIEACSCPMFCQCYFDTKPAAHGGHGDHAGHGGGEAEHFCKFNNALKVNHGHFGDTKLDGAKFWVAGDLGGDFSKGKMDWAVLTFDPATTHPQRMAIKQILTHLYPVQWGSFEVYGDQPIEWRADKDTAVARLGGGKGAEVVLKRWPGSDSDQPVVIHNLKYWGAPRNDGFVLMPNQVEALRKAPEGKKPFEFKGSNGFMITFDINSDDVTKQKSESEAGKKA